MKRLLTVAAVAAAIAWPGSVLATHIDDLRNVYESRPDLQAVFRADNWQIRDEMRSRYDLTDLEDWARQWGWKEHDILFPYSPTVQGSTHKEALRAIYEQRSDLQKVFRPDNWAIREAYGQGDMADLEDWAGLWGYQEYPGILFKYAPEGHLPLASEEAPIIVIGEEEPIPDNALSGAVPASQQDSRPNIDPLSPLDLVGTERSGPWLPAGPTFPYSTVSADGLLVVDATSGEVLLARNSLKSWPMASITKLMTVMLVLDHQVPMTKVMTIERQDLVGGVRLRISDNSRLTVGNLLYATLVGSANDAAHALARSTGLTIPQFVAEMNAKAEKLGLEQTVFVDPTGIEVENCSTPRDVIRMLDYALANYHLIRAATTTDEKTVRTTAGEERDLENTDKLLVDPDNGLYVMGGKTGYLHESQWNLVLKVKDYRGKPVYAAVFGADAKSWVFSETAKAVRWVWSNYRW